MVNFVETRVISTSCTLVCKKMSFEIRKYECVLISHTNGLIRHMGREPILYQSMGKVTGTS